MVFTDFCKLVIDAMVFFYEYIPCYFSCIKGIVGNVTKGSCDDGKIKGRCVLDSYKPSGRSCKFCPDTKQDVSASLMGFQNIEKVSVKYGMNTC